jgi:hypothetical protein
VRHLILVVAALTAACGKQETNRAASDLHTLDVAEPPPAIVAPPRSTPPPSAPGFAGETGGAAQASVPVAPQIAYTYSLGYRVAAEQVAAVQQRHIALCDRLGPARCHVVTMRRDGSPEGGAAAALTLVVEARVARAFQDRLDAAVAGAGGALSTRAVEAEDLSKEIVDTAARLRGKEALAQRLLALLGKRDGKVGELVEAERAYAQAQEELDAARSWLGEMRGRVAMSKFDIRYEGAAPTANSAWSPVRDAFRGTGEVLGASAARLITVLLALVPWGAALVLLLWLLRRRGWRPRLSWLRLRRRPPG